MTTITEIAPDIFNISIFLSSANMQYNHFLVRDEQPLLYHTGSRSMFPQVLEAMKQVLPPEQLRWISFSHFETDECGALNEWLDVAPQAHAVCTPTAARVNLLDFAARPPRSLDKDEVLATGKFRFRLLPTPHLPHGWDAGMLFEETQRILFCSDLFHQMGDAEPVTRHSVIGRARDTLLKTQSGPLRDYIPYTSRMDSYIHQLAGLKPEFLATQHGSTFIGDGAQALLELGQVIREVYERD